MSSFDPVLLAVISNRLDTIVREMENTLLRSGRSAVLNQARDFSCALVTGDARLLASAEGFPGVRAAVYGVLAAVLVGALTNDSGPIILLIGSSYLLFTVVYLAAVPGPGARTTAIKESRLLAADSH